jgi:hypothetical protein
MALEFTPALPTVVASLTRTQAPGSGTTPLLTWVPGMDALVQVTAGVSPAQTGGTVLVTATYVDPYLQTTATVAVVDAVVGTGTTTGVAEILVEGNQPVTVSITPTATGAVTVTAHLTQVREGA